MCEVDWKLLLGYFQALTSWPVIVLFLTIWVCKKFQGAISKWIENARLQAKAGDLSLDAAPVRQSVEKEVVEPGLLNQAHADEVIKRLKETYKRAEEELARHAMKGVERAEVVNGTAIAVATSAGAASATVLPDWIQNDANALQELQYIQARPVETLEQYRRLREHLKFEKAFRVIFGTQVNCLDYLSKLRALKGQDLADVRQLMNFYNEHVSLAKERNTIPAPPEAFFSFLSQRGLVSFMGSNPANGMYSINGLGEGFLDYIKTNYPAVWNTNVL